MTRIYHLLLIAAIILTFSCKHQEAQNSEYNSEVCNALALKIEQREDVSQDDYRQMIVQYEFILRYFVSCSDYLCELPEDRQELARRELLATPEYIERSAYLYTLGNALLIAEKQGMLNAENSTKLADLDEYNAQIIDFTAPF